MISARHQLLMMKANSHFGTLRYPLIKYTVLFTDVPHHLNKKLNWF